MGIEVVVTDWWEAGKILCSPRRRAEVAYVVSIGGVADRPPAGWRNARRRLRLQFEDTLFESEGGPSSDDVARLIQFAEGVELARGTLLVHCRAGISRSTAAAAIVLAVALGSGQEEAAMREVFRVQPEARPNRRMLELADAALRNGGAFVRAATAVARIEPPARGSR